MAALALGLLGKAAADLCEVPVDDRVLPPVLEVEVPPLGLVHGEAFALHRLPQQFTMFAFGGLATRVVGIRTRGHLVIDARHRHGLARAQLVEREIDGAATIVSRALGGIGNEFSERRRRRFPEDLRDPPRAIGIVNQQPIALTRERAVDAQECFSCGPLQVCGRPRVDRRAQEVVGGRVTNVELDRRIELRELDQIDAAELTRFGRRLCRECLRAQLGHRSLRCDAEDAVAADAFVWLFAAAARGDEGHKCYDCRISDPAMNHADGMYQRLALSARSSMTCTQNSRMPFFGSREALTAIMQRRSGGQ